MRSASSAIASNVATADLAVPEAGDEVLEAQLRQAPAHLVELGRAELDQVAALAHQVQRLAQAGLAGVQAPNDRLQPRGRGLVRLRLGGLLAHPSSPAMVASTAASAKNSRTAAAGGGAGALVMTLPARSSTTA